MLKKILIFAAGLGVGAGGSYLFLKKKFENELAERMEKELEKVNELYDELVAQKNFEKINEEYASSDKGEPDADEPRVSRPSFSKKVPVAEPASVPYHKMFKGADPAESEHPEDDDPENNLSENERAGLDAEEERDIKRAPVQISEDDFGEYASFEQESWIYFPETRTFEDEDGEEVYNAEEIIGDAITDWMDNPYDDDTVYVRSYRLHTDYEISKVDGDNGNLRR